MIIDTLANAPKYFAVHPLFQQAFEYMAATNLHNVETGRYEIAGAAVRAIFSNDKGMTAAESIASFECHNKHIDIQLCIDGTETFGWKPRETCHAPNGSYDEANDVQLYTDVPDMYFQLTGGQFVILFPEDVHAPMIAEGKIKKAVFKIKI